MADKLSLLWNSDLFNLRWIWSCEFLNCSFDLMQWFSNCIQQRSPIFLTPGTGFMEDSFSTGRGWGWGWGMVQAVMQAMGSDGERQVKLCWLAAHPSLTSCCAARFLTGRGPVPVCGLGVGDPWYTVYILCASESPGLASQNTDYWFCRSEVGPPNLHFLKILRWWRCRSHTVRVTGMTWCSFSIAVSQHQGWVTSS